MGQITSVELTVSGPVSGMVKAHVDVVIVFSQREISENMDYGVNLCAFLYDPDVSVFPGHKAMDVAIVPPHAAGQMETGFDRKTIKPVAQSVMVSLDAYNSDTAWPSGSKLQAVVTVVPEISETVNFSSVMPVP